MNLTIQEMMDQAEPAIRQVIRRKLGPSPDQTEDCAQQVRLDLIEKFQRVLGGVDSPIESLPDYAARVAYNVVNDGFRSQDNTRTRLKNRLRRFLSKQPAYGVWPGPGGNLVGGYTAWEQLLTPPGTSAAAEVRTHPSLLDASVFPQNHWENLDRNEWNQLMEGVFDHIGGPLELDRLVDLVGTLLGVEWSTRPDSLDAVDEDEERAGHKIEIPDPGSTPADDLEIREELGILWECIGKLPREWMLAVMLNPPSVRKDLRGELAVFVAHGIAAIADIGETLGLSEDDYEKLETELQIPNGGQPQARFLEIWERLPLPDTLIGKLLGKSHMQVIGLRKLAIRRLARCKFENE